MKTAWALVTIAFAAYSNVAAAEEQLGPFFLHADKNLVKLEGAIERGAGSQFDAVLAKVPGLQFLELNSPGGNVVASLEIANKVNALAISTVISSAGDCASACSIIFLAGKSRHVAGRLGVHQLSTRGEENMAAVQFAIADILDAFQRFGVDPRVTRYMLTTPSSGMYYFSEYELGDYRINRNEEPAQVIIAKSDTTPEIKFADFTAVGNFNGEIVLPNFKKDEGARYFRTRIRNGMKQGPNFAGHYSLLEVGCGTSCIFGILLDANSGKRVKFPLGGEENYQLEMTYTVESSLLKAVWMDTGNGNYDTCVNQDYVLENDSFRLLKENRYTIREFSFCAAYQ